MEINTIYIQDCQTGLKKLPDKSVNCCVTSPPYYGLRDYGTAIWVGGDPNCDHRTFDNDIVNAGEKQKTNLGSNRTFKSICKRCGAIRVDKQIGLEETPEQYAEKLVTIFREVRRVLKDDGTLWLNIGDSYNGSGGPGSQWDNKNTKGLKSGKFKKYKNPNRNINNLKPKDLIGIPWSIAFALRTDGWYLRSDIIWHKRNCMPSSVKDRPTTAHEYIFLLSKSQRYYYDADAVKEKMTNSSHKRMEYPRYTDGSKGSTGNYAVISSNYGNKNEEKRNKRSVWTVNTQPFKNAHFAVFPEKLIEPCIKAGCPENGIVLDPFMGAGTTAIVARKLNRNFIGFELNKEYVEIANKRLYKELGMFL
jgi:DNA modification methylase